VRKNNQNAKSSEPSRRRLRCAIYTQKSTEEGLEQEFDSLEAQREAARPSFRASGEKDGSRCRGGQGSGDHIHRNQLGRFDVGDLMLVGTADINQRNTFGRFEAAAVLPEAQLKRQTRLILRAASSSSWPWHGRR
jgi:hypothetical protein